MDVNIEKLATLKNLIAPLNRVVVAFSGGVDSTLLAAVATSVLGKENVICVTAVSPSLAGSELADCAELASTIDLNWMTVNTDEMERAAYRRNDRDRCFHCKTALMDAVEPIAVEFGAVVVLGVNLDDLGDERPGQVAAAERGAVFPMVEAALTKADVRTLSHHLAIPTWNKPAMACLASRVPTGTPVTVNVLTKVERAEAFLRSIGITGNIRVRHFEGIACIEVDSVQFATVESQRSAIVGGLQALGYERVVLDLAGFRSGSLSRVASPASGEESAPHLGLSGRHFQDLVS